MATGLEQLGRSEGLLQVVFHASLGQPCSLTVLKTDPKKLANISYVSAIW